MSDLHLSFSQKYHYTDSNITIPVVIRTNLMSRVQIRAKVDTGSDFCIFQPYLADELGIDLEGGHKQRIRTVVGSFAAYGHEVTLTVLNLEWQAIVYFAQPYDFPVNVVGRKGFLDRVRFGLIDYEQVIYLDDYNTML